MKAKELIEKLAGHEDFDLKFCISDVTDRAIVYCTVCDAQISIRPNEQEAIEAWNKRVPCDTCAMYYPDDGCMAGLVEGEVAE